MKISISILISLLLLVSFQLFADESTQLTSGVQQTIIDTTTKIIIANCDTCSIVHTACFSCKIKRQWYSYENILAFLPVILYLIFLFYLRIYLHKGGFRLADALTENEPVQLTKPNPNPELAATTPPVTTIELPKSTSRLIVFISGFTSITLGVCFTSYYMYIFFNTGCAPNLEHLTNVLLSLGIGVIPYALNKVSGALTFK